MTSIINDIIRSACECERPEEHDTDTVELRVSDLRAILELHLAGPVAAEPWRPIETAPRDETRLLLRSRSGLHADGYWLRAAYNGNGAWVWPYVHANPIEWMPLPAPPPHLRKPGTPFHGPQAGAA